MGIGNEMMGTVYSGVYLGRLLCCFWRCRLCSSPSFISSNAKEAERQWPLVLTTKWSPIGTVGARLPQGAPNRAQSEKAENALASRIALQDKFATGVLFAIVAAICVLLFSLIAYIVTDSAGKLLDVSFLTGKPETVKEAAALAPSCSARSCCWVLTLLISVPIALGGAIYLTEYARRTA